MATKTGTITARVTQYGYRYYSKSTSEGQDLLAAGTGKWTYNGTSSYAFSTFYGFDFTALNNLNNVTITGFSLNITGGRYSSSSGSKHYLGVSFCSGFPASGNASFTYTNDYEDYDVNDSGIYQVTSGSIAADTVTTITSSSAPSVLNWMNANLSSVINGYTTPSFGLWFKIRYGQIREITMTLNYTYEEIEYVTVSTSVSPTGAGTVSPSSQTVKEGETASVTATPNAGYRFSHWLINGADSGATTPTLSGTITADTLCTAVFVLDKINKIFVGTSQPKAIYIGTQEVKEVYVGTKKVYG